MIVNFKQQRIMKPIYNVWILLFCLTFSSCYNEDIINPTPDPLALAGGFEFPQGNNSWDNDVMKIYQDFGVKIIYKDITEKDLNKNWTNGGVGSSSRVFENCLNDEMGAFYITFMKNHIFPYLNREVTDRVFPMYWYMVYNYSVFTSIIPGVLEYYVALPEPALYDGEYNPDCFEWVANESCAEGVYAWLRKGRGQNLLCVMNTQDHAHKKFPLYLKFPCSAELVLDTEAGTWGGVHKAHRKQSFHTTDGGVFGRDYTLTLDLPAMGSYLLRLSPEAPNPDAARLSANRALAQKRKAAKAAKAAAEVSDK